MIKITVKTIEVDQVQFRKNVIDLCCELNKYLGIEYLTRERFNKHFKTKLSDLEFAKIMDDNWFEIEKLNRGVGVRINIENLLKSLQCQNK